MIEGGCLCGAVRYRISAEPLLMRACWCRVCQFIATGNATINLGVPSNAITITGSPKDYTSTADSGRHMHRRFCPSCGTHLFSESEERPDMIIVRAGTLDDTSIVAPTAAIWIARAPAWARIDPEMAHFDGQPPP